MMQLWYVLTSSQNLCALLLRPQACPQWMQPTYLQTGWFPFLGSLGSSSQTDTRVTSDMFTVCLQTFWHSECLLHCLPPPDRRTHRDTMLSLKTCWYIMWAQTRPIGTSCCLRLNLRSIALKMTGRDPYFSCRASTLLHLWQFRYTLLSHLPDCMQTNYNRPSDRCKTICAKHKTNKRSMLTPDAGM